MEHADACRALVLEFSLLGTLKRRLARTPAASGRWSDLAFLWHLERAPGVRMNELATRLDLDLSVVSRQVAELEAAGHVRRVPEPTDRRASLLEPTEQGLELLPALLEELAGSIAPDLAGWDPEDLLRLVGGLQQLRTELLASAAPAAPHP